MNTLAVKAAAKTAAKKAGPYAPPPPEEFVAALTKFIPTESVTLYVALVSAQAALASMIPWLTPSRGYVLCVVLTPVIQLTLYLNKLKTPPPRWKVPPTEWPLWTMIASTIAFSVWAMAIPGNPIIDVNSVAGGAVAGLAAVFVSMGLNLVAGFFDK